MAIAIALTLMLGTIAMSALVRINWKQYAQDRQKRSRDAAMVAMVMALWCLYAALWLFCNH